MRADGSFLSVWLERHDRTISLLPPILTQKQTHPLLDQMICAAVNLFVFY